MFNILVSYVKMQKIKYRIQNTEYRRQKTEDRRQKMEGRRQKIEGRRQDRTEGVIGILLFSLMIVFHFLRCLMVSRRVLDGF